MPSGRLNSCFHYSDLFSLLEYLLVLCPRPALGWWGVIAHVAQHCLPLSLRDSGTRVTVGHETLESCIHIVRGK